MSLDPAMNTEIHDSGVFEKVIAINILAGNVAKPSKETVAHQMSIISDEVDELVVGVDASFEAEIRDGVADVLFTMAGMYGRLGRPVPEVFMVPEVGSPEILAKLCIAVKDINQMDLRDPYAVLMPIFNEMVGQTIAIAQQWGYPFVEDLEEVCRSNMSKFDTNPEDAARTVEKYKSIGVDVIQLYRTAEIDGENRGFIVTYSARDQRGDDDRNYPGMKWLKSINFEEPKFSNI